MEILVLFLGILLTLVIPALSVVSFLQSRGTRRAFARLEMQVAAQDALLHELSCRLNELSRRSAPAGAPPPGVAEAPVPAAEVYAAGHEEACRRAAAPLREDAAPDEGQGWVREVPVPAATPPAPAASPPRSALDWETLLGVRGAAWVGAIALIIAGSLFAKYSIEHNLIPPAVRVALIVLAGIACLVGAELVLRRGYATTANAAGGAGIALLYAGFFAAHVLYQLVSLPATFALMVLTTLVAVLLALRYDALVIAVLGLLGGFGTPLVLSTGQDRPVGLFGYVLLLDVGLLLVAIRRGWTSLVHLTLGATLLVEFFWFDRFMAPGKLPIAAVALDLFAVLFLVLPWLAPAAQRRHLLHGAVLGGLYPFLFALYLAPQPAYAKEWGALFGLLGCLDAAIIAVVLLRGQAPLLLAASVATVLSVLLWAAEGLQRPVLLGATLGAMALAALLNLPPRLHARLKAPGTTTAPFTLELSALCAALGLYGYGWVLVSKGLGDPPWTLLLLLLSLIALALERGRPASGLRQVAWSGPPAVVLLCLAWFATQLDNGTLRNGSLLRDLTVTLLVAPLAALLAAARGLLHGRAAARDIEIGAAAAALLTFLAPLLVVSKESSGVDLLTVLAPLCVGLVLLFTAALRQGFTQLLLPGLALAALSCTAWHLRFFQPGDLRLAAPVYIGLYLYHLLAPFWVPPGVADWRLRRGPWLTAALAGPLFFPVLYRCYRDSYGKATIAALPVVLAALSLLGVAGVLRRFPARDPSLARARLRSLAMMASVSIGFLCIAIPLQLERQWIPIGWALTAAGVLWLYLRLPHPGLKHLGGLLGLAAAACLLANATVPTYALRGRPVFNWILYTYGVCAAALLLGAALLAPVEQERLSARERRLLANGRLCWTPALRLLALLLLFALINLEIADYFSPGRYPELGDRPRYARDLTTSVAWALYALCLLVVGLWRKARTLRFLSLAFMLLSIGKVFLYDLSRIRGIYQVLSFLGLAASLIGVSLLYQRFVFRKEPST